MTLSLDSSPVPKKVFNSFDLLLQEEIDRKEQIIKDGGGDPGGGVEGHENGKKDKKRKVLTKF